MPTFGLADCNNFYCSCERVFRPDLREQPVVVLSNNDGCVIARSEESKALGIKMGVAYYQVRSLIERNNVSVFSSNYNLYGDMSRRVMSLLSNYTPKIDIYSIDEAFLDFSGMEHTEDLNAYGKNLVRTIKKGTGIPISLGIAPTKTLAKMASKFAKKHKGYEGVCIIDNDTKREKALQLFDIADVWGIGRKHGALLRYHGIETAWDLSQKSEAWVRRMLQLPGVRLWRELNGESCISIEELPHKKSICTSRSFAERGLDRLSDLEQAIAEFSASCSQKLRAQQTKCQAVTVFAYTSRFREDLPQMQIHSTVHLSVPTNDLRELVSISLNALRAEWQEGYFFYKKAGVIVWNILPESMVQGDLFDPIDRAKQSALAKVVDAINLKNGHNTVRTGAQGFEQHLQLKREHISKQYTTNLRDIIVVKSG